MLGSLILRWKGRLLWLCTRFHAANQLRSVPSFNFNLSPSTQADSAPSLESDLRCGVSTANKGKIIHHTRSEGLGGGARIQGISNDQKQTIAPR